MELPFALRQAVDAALEGVALGDLTRAADRLSQRYRSELRDGGFHLSDDLAARAYLAVRLPATFAATRASLTQVVAVKPEFAPRSLLDVGAGPGSALWAAAETWDSLEDALMLEGSPAIRGWGERLSRDTGLRPRLEWRQLDVSMGLSDLHPRDLVTLAYVLDELDESARDALVQRLWALTADTLVVVEPGTPAGWARILRARSLLLEAGAHILAPCPHAATCPLVSPDWCHFSRRVSRSRLHRLTKRGEVPWEDEKFMYIAVSRFAGRAYDARVLAPPKATTGRVGLKLCKHDGSAQERLFTKREGEVYKVARRLEWGEQFDALTR